jgi:2-amino-4-hydroxy-6-hydroxymethyldihydropteridine diphosphokinase
MILAGLGGNLHHARYGPPVAVLEAALQVLDAIDITVEARSPWYRSAPVPRSDQPDFINGVISIATALSPEQLLARFHAIETRFGRVRGTANAARTLDLDLLAYDRLVTGDPEAPECAVVVPHPRLQLRAFVLLPLRDLVPDWSDPRDGRSIDDLVAALPEAQECRRLDPGET